MTDFPVKGSITKTSFNVLGGASFNITVTGTPGTSAAFTSSNTSVVPPPNTTLIPASGILTMSVATNAVTQDTYVTLAVSASPVMSDDTEVKGTAFSLELYIQAN